jgi:hypothetical protein
MSRLSQAAAKLRERADALNAKAEAAEARAKIAANKKLTHRKIVLGGFFFSVLGPNLEKLPPEWRERMDKYHTRASDRRALGLAELPTDIPSPSRQ